jgi:hypothetical protein
MASNFVIRSSRQAGPGRAATIIMGTRIETRSRVRTTDAPPGWALAFPVVVGFEFFEEEERVDRITSSQISHTGAKFYIILKICKKAEPTITKMKNART